jgi:hypothetical protein
MTGIEPHTEGHWCTRCHEFRVRAVGVLCPICKDDDARAEQAAREVKR